MVAQFPRQLDVDHEGGEGDAPPAHAQRLQAVARLPQPQDRFRPHRVGVQEDLPAVGILLPVRRQRGRRQQRCLHLPGRVRQGDQAGHGQRQPRRVQQRQIGRRRIVPLLGDEQPIVAEGEQQTLRQRGLGAGGLLPRQPQPVLDVHPVDVAQAAPQAVHRLPQRGPLQAAGQRPPGHQIELDNPFPFGDDRARPGLLKLDS